MASEAEAATSSGEDQQITFNVKAANDVKYVLTQPGATTVGELKEKLSTSEYADIPVERLRLIYSGRVLKDTDTLASTKVKDGNTIHMVKGAASNARQNPAAQGGTASSTTGSTTGAAAPASNVPTNIAAGTGNNPLAGLTGARYAGFHGLPNASTFGADGGMGPPMGTDDMLRMMDDPNFLSQMNEMMNLPEFQRMLEDSPMLRDQPMARQMLRDPNMRRLMFNPQMIRMQMQMQQAMGGTGAGAAAFPAPGVTDNTTPQTTSTTQPQASATDNATAPPTIDPQNPFAGLFGAMQPPAAGGTPQANPFAGLFSAMPPTSPGSTTGAAGAGAGAGGMSGISPEMNQFFLSRLLGGGDGSTNPLMGGTPVPQAPADTRPPEERYADQLRQLNDMGFYEFERNVTALRRSGGSVEGAVEHLLSGV